MKNSWLHYDYMRRWWGLLLLGTLLGGVVGLAYYSSQAHPVEYAATATVSIKATAPRFETPPGPVVLTIDTGSQSSEAAAVEDLTSTVAALIRYTLTPVAVQELAVERYTPDAVWWKPVILGSLAGTLLAIAGIYLWEDARAFRRHLYQGV